jgi:hypothetical protein
MMSLICPQSVMTTALTVQKLKLGSQVLKPEIAQKLIRSPPQYFCPFDDNPQYLQNYMKTEKMGVTHSRANGGSEQKRLPTWFGDFWKVGQSAR